MPTIPALQRLCPLAALALLILLSLSGCSGQDREQKPAAEANASQPGNATLAAVPLANATLAATPAAVQSANATLAAGLSQPAAKPARPARAAEVRDKPAKPAKTGKALAAAGPARPAAKASAASSGPLTLDRVREEFAVFAGQWLASLSRNMLGSAARMEVAPSAEGFVARFTEVDSATLELEVKPTDTPACPFVGVMRYFERSYECRGDTPDAARTGSFAPVRNVRITEIFRHSGKRWE